MDIIIAAGTAHRETVLSAPYPCDDPAKYNFQITTGYGYVSVLFQRRGAASGGYLGGSYNVVRKARANLPIKLAIEMVINGLTQGEHELSSSEARRLILAVAGNMPDDKISNVES